VCPDSHPAGGIIGEGADVSNDYRKDPSQSGWPSYRINSAALRFIGVDDLESEGYGAYSDLFDPAHNTAHNTGSAS
jgi:hypothetical protein